MKYKDKYKYKNKILTFIILISLITCFYYGYKRMQAESVYKGYEILADYDEFSKLGYAQNKNPKDYFKELSENNVTTVSLNESTINSMKSSPKSKVKTEMDGDDLIVYGTKEDLDFIKEGLKSLKEKRVIEDLSENSIKIHGEAKDIVSFKVDAYDIYQNKIGNDGSKISVLEYVGLGFDERKINEIKDIDNLNLNLRPIYNSKIQDGRFVMERFINSINAFSPEQNYLVFAGKEFFKDGEDDNKIVEDFREFLKSKNMALGMIEAATQRGHLDIEGINDTIKRDDIKKIRVFTTWDYLQKVYDYIIPNHQNGEELTNVYYRAVSERNIAAIYLRPFIKNDSFIVEAEKYGYVLESLNNRLEEKGYEAGHVNGMGDFNVNTKLKFIVALGVIAGGMILLQSIFKIPLILETILFILASLMAFVFFILGKKSDIGNILFNLLAIVIYPSISVLVVVNNYKNTIRRASKNNKILNIFVHGMLLLLLAICISMIGSFMEVAFMSGTNYLVELNIFRGVKISQILPILISMFIYASLIGFGDDEKENNTLSIRGIGDLLSQNVKIWQAMAAGMFLLIMGIFLLRGGNSSTKVPGMELYFRNMLEKYFYARPRTKAILIGYPAVVMLIYIAYKKRGKILSFMLTLFVAIGMADIVNTFSHIRTPLKMSIMRILIEYFVCVIFVIGFLLVAEIIRWFHEKYC